MSKHQHGGLTKRAGGAGPEGRQEVRFLGPISVNLDTVLERNLDTVLERILDTVLGNHLHISN